MASKASEAFLLNSELLVIMQRLIEKRQQRLQDVEEAEEVGDDDTTSDSSECLMPGDRVASFEDGNSITSDEDLSYYSGRKSPPLNESDLCNSDVDSEELVSTDTEHDTPEHRPLHTKKRDSLFKFIVKKAQKLKRSLSGIHQSNSTKGFEETTYNPNNSTGIDDDFLKTKLTAETILTGEGPFVSGPTTSCTDSYLSSIKYRREPIPITNSRCSCLSEESINHLLSQLNLCHVHKEVTRSQSDQNQSLNDLSTAAVQAVTSEGSLFSQRDAMISRREFGCSLTGFPEYRCSLDSSEIGTGGGMVTSASGYLLTQTDYRKSLQLDGIYSTESDHAPLASQEPSMLTNLSEIVNTPEDNSNKTRFGVNKGHIITTLIGQMRRIPKLWKRTSS